MTIGDFFDSEEDFEAILAHVEALPEGPGVVRDFVKSLSADYKDSGLAASLTVGGYHILCRRASQPLPTRH
jgi:hypothetical protein